MNNYVVLNYRDHGALKVITKRSKSLGDDVMHVMTFPHEFRDIQSCYPIYFKKDLETGSFCEKCCNKEDDKPRFPSAFSKSIGLTL